jgi:hypothetical protein
MDLEYGESGVIVRWNSCSNRTYSLYRVDILSGIQESTMRSGIPATPPSNEVREEYDGEAGFYRLSVEHP